MEGEGRGDYRKGAEGNESLTLRKSPSPNLAFSPPPDILLYLMMCHLHCLPLLSRM